MALATLADVKTYLAITSTDEDARLTALLAGADAQVLKYLGYDPALQTYSVRLNGNGRRWMLLSPQPVVSILSLSVDGINIQAQTSPPLGDGYVLSCSMIWLFGGRVFTKGLGNVMATYQAGYATIPKALTHGVVTLVAQRFHEIKRLGIASKSLAGESVSYTNAAMPDAVRGYLDSFRQVYA